MELTEQGFYELAGAPATGIAVVGAATSTRPSRPDADGPKEIVAAAVGGGRAAAQGGRPGCR